LNSTNQARDTTTLLLEKLVKARGDRFTPCHDEAANKEKLVKARGDRFTPCHDEAANKCTLKSQCSRWQPGLGLGKRGTATWLMQQECALMDGRLPP
jgi:hypothetical protein